MNPLPFIQITFMLFFSACVSVTTYETNTSVTDIAAIRANCINAISGCYGYCANKIKYAKQPVDRILCNRIEDSRSKDLACMSQHQDEFRAWFFSPIEFPCSRFEQ